MQEARKRWRMAKKEAILALYVPESKDMGESKMRKKPKPNSAVVLVAACE
jgi:hypothetical protein